MTITLVLEDGTAVVGANAYDTPETAIEWLVDHGYHALETEAGNDEAKGLLRIVEATEVIEREARPRVTGFPLDEDQGLLYPRTKTTDSKGRELEDDERPAGLREAIFLMAEEMAVAAQRAERIALIDPDANVAYHWSGATRTDLRRGKGFGELYPHVWARLGDALPPPGLRLRRA